MPIIGTWITPTQGTMAASALQTALLYGQTSSATTSGYTWCTTNMTQTAAALSNNAAVFYQNQAGLWIDQEVWVDQQQYLTLAQNRVLLTQVRTEEQQQEQLRQQEQVRLAAQELAQRQAAQRRDALARSRELLLSHLTPLQRDTFEKNKWFIVLGGKSKKPYRINTDRYTGNIDIMHGSKVTHKLCVHCDSNIPLHDHHLMQKLSLECDEDAILRIANRSVA